MNAAAFDSPAAVRGTFDTTFDTALEWRRRVNQARLDAGADVNTRDAAGTGAVWATAAVPDQKILAAADPTCSAPCR